MVFVVRVACGCFASHRNVLHGVSLFLGVWTIHRRMIRWISWIYGWCLSGRCWTQNCDRLVFAWVFKSFRVVTVKIWLLHPGWVQVVYTYLIGTTRMSSIDCFIGICPKIRYIYILSKYLSNHQQLFHYQRCFTLIKLLDTLFKRERVKCEYKNGSNGNKKN